MGPFKIDEILSKTNAKLEGRAQTVNLYDLKPYSLIEKNEDVHFEESAESNEENNENTCATSTHSAPTAPLPNEDPDLVELEVEIPEHIFYIPVSSAWQTEKTSFLDLPLMQEHSFQDPFQFPITQPPTECEPIEKDGNCLFRALSFFVTGSQDFHIFLRETICNFLESNFELMDLEPNYVASSKMRSSSTWGTDMEIFAAASLLNTRIFVYTEFGPSWKWLLHSPLNSNVDNNSPALYINHARKNHYEPAIFL